MVRKLANPPMILEIGSARNTPFTPKPRTGNSKVKGTTIIIFRRREKKIARFAQPRDVKVDCPTN